MITESNKDTFVKDIKDMKGLTVGEVGLLMRLQLESGMRKAFGGEDRKIVGKRIGDLLVELKKEDADQQKETQRQERLAAEVKAKQDARIAELRKALTLTVADKGYSKAEYEEYITIDVAYENTSGKDIRAFRGKIQFTDLFGKEIYESNVTISDPVKAGDRGEWKGTIKYNEFIDEQKRLLNTDLKDMKVVWKPMGVIFADGSEMKADE